MAPRTRTTRPFVSTISIASCTTTASRTRKPPARPFWRGCRVVGQGLGPNDDEAISKA